MKKSRSIISLLFVCIFIFSLSVNVSAIKNTKEDLMNEALYDGQGGLEPGEKNPTNGQLLQAALKDLSDSEKQKIYNKIETTEKIKQSITTMKSGQVQPFGTYLGYVLLVTPVKQETRDWCSAATVQQTLRYVGSSYSTQSKIMGSLGAGPSLQKVVNYINDRLPSSYADYIRTQVTGRTDFDAKLRTDVLYYQPMIFTLKNQSGTSVWPYQTNGHFTNCDGDLDNQYLFSDPFYFLEYVSSATDNNGYHYRTFNQLWDVNTQHFGVGQNVVAY